MDRITRRRYHEAIRYAQFYTWNALRGHALPGNDPFTTCRANAHRGREESRVAYKAMARFWLEKARAIRLAV
jgi:hypothetical protein